MEYPDAACALNFRSPEELLVATILSAQCTDAMVNRVTPSLFAAYPVPEGLASAPLHKIERLIRSCGYYRQKARNIKGTCTMLCEKYGGKVPHDMEELLLLPGVARKTANVVLSVAFGINEGIAVDTHVKRLSRRLRLTANSDPAKIERDLMKLVKRKEWGDLTNLMIAHGRKICTARKPACDACVLNDVCPSARPGSTEERKISVA